jgi:hypothetical protein
MDLGAVIVASDEQIARWARFPEDVETRTGKRLVDARRDIARRIGILPGTLENLRRGGRLPKGTPPAAARAIAAAFVAEVDGRVKRGLAASRRCAPGAIVSAFLAGAVA